VGAGLRPIRPASRPQRGPATAVLPMRATPWVPPPLAAAPSRSRRAALPAAVSRVPSAVSDAVADVGSAVGSAVLLRRWPSDRRRATIALLVTVTLAHGLVLGWLLGRPHGTAGPAVPPTGQHAIPATPAGPPIPTAKPSAPPGR
jgi:hypothetical protein